MTPSSRSLLILALAIGGSLGARVSAVEGGVIPVPPPPAVGVIIPADPLATLVAQHPRLLVGEADFTRVAARATRDPAYARMLAQVAKEAALLVAKPLCAYPAEAEGNMLKVSQGVKKLVFTLALQYRLTGDPALVERIWRELESARSFPDWKPSHFLDTAEMTAAFAIAYDWLFAAWSPERRALLRQAIREKGLNAGLDVYARADRDGVKDARVGGWARLNHNWNQVCNGGMLLGALAIADEEPEVARSVVRAALTSLPYALVEYGPDGAWGEGTTYWGFATEFTVYALASLQTSLGTDFGLSEIPGLAKTGDFPRAYTSPTGMPYNFADGGMYPVRSYPCLFWLATRYRRPDWAASQLPELAKHPEPIALLWSESWLDQTPPPVQRPLLSHFRHHEIVTMRTAWDDSRAWWVGAKGGDNQINHGHLDLGSFVLDAFGQRWGYDLGADEYSLPDYFGPKRWTYYRLRAEAHNTLVLNPGTGPDQDPYAKAAVIATGRTGDRNFAVIELSAAYAPHAQAARRGLALGQDGLTVQDELKLPKPTDVWWMFHTAATISLQGATADLTFRGEHLQARIRTPEGAVFTTLPAGPLPSSPNPEGQLIKAVGGSPKEPMQTLAIHLPTAAGEVRLVVEFTRPGQGLPPVLPPLAEWR